MATKTDQSFLKGMGAECPFCNMVCMHLHALRSHVGKMHKQFADKFFAQLKSQQTEETTRSADHYMSKYTSPTKYKPGRAMANSHSLPKQVRRIPKPEPISPKRSSALAIPRQNQIPFTHFTYSDGSKTERNVPNMKYSSSSEEDLGVVTPIGTLMFCGYCQEKFYDEKYLLMHIRNEHTEDLMVDPSEIIMESAAFTDRDNVSPPPPKQPRQVMPKMPSKTLAVTTTSGGKFQCGICDKSFFNPEVLKRHIKAIHAGRAAASHSGREIVHKADRMTSLPKASIKTEDSPEKSNNYRTRDRAAMTASNRAQAYQKEFSGLEGTYRCPFCSFISVSCDDDLMREHVMDDHLELIGQDLHCPYCPSITTRQNGRASFFKHIGSHDEEKPFSCSNCGRRFRQARQLLKHERTGRNC